MDFDNGQTAENCNILLRRIGRIRQNDSQRLLRKLRARGVPVEIMNVIQSWLSDRTDRVAVSGKLSKDMHIHNMVYQGTVLGPPLWNIFYADAAVAVNLLGFLEIIFADDFNAWQKVHCRHHP